MKKFGGTVKIKSGALRDVVLTKKVWERTQKLGILRQNMKKLWERRLHAFPPHYPLGAPDIYPKTKAPACNFFQNNDQQTLHAIQQLLTDCPDRLTRFSVQYRPSKNAKYNTFCAMVK